MHGTFGSLKAFRANQREEQVDQQTQGHDADDEVFHGSDLSKGMSVSDTNDKKADESENEYKVHHGTAFENQGCCWASYKALPPLTRGVEQADR